MAASYDELRARLRRFVDERAWDAFHTPKDLAMSVAIESAELLEVFQWRDLQAADLAPEDRARIGEELADVLLYAMLLADKTGVDLLDAVARKLEENARKYPADKARGRADKYDRL
ncbi:MAG TPA: nucleotide pyrophosphohydrolase [Candidatus Thermoplasmatota archaeon]|nr:nucleotide pyrophosphohydrolase [Candidatus Thermoplasmatota archaeon]